jgi:hypothetical protein
VRARQPCGTHLNEVPAAGAHGSSSGAFLLVGFGTRSAPPQLARTPTPRPDAGVRRAACCSTSPCTRYAPRRNGPAPPGGNLMMGFGLFRWCWLPS